MLLKRVIVSLLREMYCLPIHCRYSKVLRKFGNPFGCYFKRCQLFRILCTTT